MQWERKERSLHEAISRSPSATNVRKALKYFQVARGFSGLEENADKVVDALKNYSKRLDNKTIISRVSGLADVFKRDFRSRNLSAASKLLWLSCRNPVVIMDLRTVTSLHNLGYKFANKDYESYYKNWRTEYDYRYEEIKKATKKLDQIREFTTSWNRSLKDVRQDIRSDWFIERTFDLFLWEIGGPR